MLKRHEVEILLKAGHSKTEVARLAGVSLILSKRWIESLSILLPVDTSIRAACELYLE